MSDEDLGRPLAPCSLNFTLAEISVTDVSGEIIVIPGTSPEAGEAVLDAHSPIEPEVREVRLTKRPYNPAFEPLTIATHTVQTWIASLQPSVQDEMAGRLPPYNGDIVAASLNQDRAAIRAIMGARRQRSMDPPPNMPEDLAERPQTKVMITTDGPIGETQPPVPANGFYEDSVSYGELPGCPTVFTRGRSSYSPAGHEDTNLIHIDIEFGS